MTRDQREPGAKPRLNVKQHLDMSHVDVAKGRSRLESALQYLLSEDEYNSLKARADNSDGVNALREARTLLRVSLLKSRNVLCIHDRAKPDEKTRRLYYCSECPVQSMANDRDVRVAMCPLEWEFSK